MKAVLEAQASDNFYHFIHYLYLWQHVQKRCKKMAVSYKTMQKHKKLAEYETKIVEEAQEEEE